MPKDQKPRLAPGYATLWIQDIELLRKDHPRHLTPQQFAILSVYKMRWNPKTWVSDVSDSFISQSTGFDRGTVCLARRRLIELNFMKQVGYHQVFMYPFHRLSTKKDQNSESCGRNPQLSGPMAEEVEKQLRAMPPTSCGPDPHQVAGQTRTVAGEPRNPLEDEDIKDIKDTAGAGNEPAMLAGASMDKPPAYKADTRTLTKLKSCKECTVLDPDRYCEKKKAVIAPTSLNRFNSCPHFNPKAKR